MSEPSKAPDSKDAKADGGAKAPRGNGLLVVLVAINTLVTAGGAAFTFLHANQAAPPAKSQAHGGKGGEKGDKKEEAEEGDEKAEESDEAEEKEEQKEGEKGEGGSLTTSQMMRVEDLVVHLRNPEVDRYARLEIDIEVDTSNALQRLESRRPAVRDAVISYMSERTYEELRGADGIANLKKALRERIEPLAPRHVRALYVTSFVVQ